MHSLPRTERLRGKERIGELFSDGSRAAHGTIAARSLPNPDGTTRVAAVAGKALGNAVLRNRMRRRIRAAYRLQKGVLPRGRDMVLVARKGLAEATWTEVLRDVRKAAERSARETCGRPPQRQTP